VKRGGSTGQPDRSGRVKCGNDEGDQPEWNRGPGLDCGSRLTALNQGELVVDGITAVELELWLDLSVGAALGPPAATPG